MKVADAAITPELIQDFRDTFTTPHGRRVFAFLLFDMGYFSDSVIDPGRCEVRNHAVRLVKILGANKPIGALFTADAIISAAQNVLIDKPNGNSKTGQSLYGEVIHKL